MADDGPRCELLYPENTYTHEEGGGALSRGASSRGRRYADRNQIYDARVRGMRSKGGEGRGRGRDKSRLRPVYAAAPSPP